MTSINHFIKALLDIKDQNLTFTNFYYSDDLRAKVLVAELKLPLDACPTCHSPLVHNGHYLSRIRYLSFDASKPILIELHKQRLLCRSCHHSFMATSPLVAKNCLIVNPLKQKLIHDLQEDRSMTAIAQANHVSPNTVLRIMQQFAPQPHLSDYDHLPEHLGLDEFRGVGQKLHFICLDGSGSHQIVKILPTRLKKDIVAFFEKFPLLVRNQVKTITMDLNSYYQEIARRLFPNAQIIIDRFHIVQMLNRSFNQLRVQTMKQFEHRDRRYRLLKYYWRSYLKPYQQLAGQKVYYYQHLKDCMTQAQIVDEGLDISAKLRASYDLMQDFRQTLKDHDPKQMAALLQTKEQLGIQMKTTLKTFRHNKQAVLNAAVSEYSNSCVEGTNRKIKQIELTAYGYRNFSNLVTRIMLESKNAVLTENTLSQIA